MVGVFCVRSSVLAMAMHDLTGLDTPSTANRAKDRSIGYSARVINRADYIGYSGGFGIPHFAGCTCSGAREPWSR